MLVFCHKLLTIRTNVVRTGVLQVLKPTSGGSVGSIKLGLTQGLDAPTDKHFCWF
jgi:hypothetical protein